MWKTSPPQLSKVLFFFLLLFSALAVAPRSQAGISSQGREFWLTFPLGDHTHPVTLQLLITGSVSTTGQVEIPGSFSTPFSVTAGSSTQVILPASAEVSAVDGVTPSSGIHVTAADQVSVVGLRYEPEGTDGYLGLPVEAAGTDFIVFTYYNQAPAGSEFAAVATQDCTNLVITPKLASGGHAAGVPYGVFLANAGDVYQFEDLDGRSDVSGTTVASDKPVGLFGAHVCGDVPGTSSPCNYLVEQLWPTAWWGTQFVTMPLATRAGGDTFRFLAASNATTIIVNGALATVLNRGQYFEKLYATPLSINSTHPIYVMQYSNSSTVDGNVNADPSMISIPPVSQFTSSYNFSAPVTAFPGNYENILAPNTALGAVTVDGVKLAASQFTPVPSSAYSGTWVATGPGAQLITASQPIGVIAYGYASYDAYGYPGGAFFTAATPVFTGTPGGVCGTPTPTYTATSTPSFTPTFTPSFTSTFTASLTRTFTFTWTPSSTFTASATPTVTFSPTFTPTITPTDTPTLTPTPTFTGTLPPTDTPTDSATPTFTPSPSFTPTLSPTFTNTLSPTWTSTPIPSLTPTDTWTPSPTDTFTVNPTPSPTPTPGTNAPCEMHVWPIPFNPKRAVGGLLKVSCLPTGATVSFFTLSGEAVQTVGESDGLAVWNGLNRNGRPVATGVYFYAVEQGGTVLLSGKLIVLNED